MPNADVKRLTANLGELPPKITNPHLVVVSGLPGSGKTHFSMQLAKRLPAVILESDALRQILFPSPDYGYQESWRLFKAIHLLIENLLMDGRPVIMDATNLNEQHRQFFYDIAKRANARLIQVRVHAPAELVKKRMGERAGNATSNSTADWNVYRKMAQVKDEINRQHYSVDTSTDITPVIDEIVHEIEGGK